MQEFLKTAILNKNNGFVEIDCLRKNFNPRTEEDIFDICIESYDEGIFLYYKRYNYKDIVYDTNIEELENPEVFCPEQFETYIEKKGFFKKKEREITYLPGRWPLLKNITEVTMEIHNKNLIVIKGN